MSGYFDNYILKVIQKLFAKDKVIDVNGVRDFHECGTTNMLTLLYREQLRSRDSES